MQRVNMYLTDEQMGLLRQVSVHRGAPLAELVREAVDDWLRQRGVRAIEGDEWQRRFDALLQRRERVADELGVTEEEVEKDIASAIAEVRAERRAGRS